MREIDVELTLEEQAKAREYSSYRWSNTKTGKYGKGILNTKDDKFKVERIGLLGEIAFAKLFNLKTDFEYRKGGDKYDFVLNGKAIDVKVAAKFPEYRKGLILRRSERGYEIKVSKDIYVFGYLKSESIVTFVGYQHKSFIEKLPIVDSRIRFFAHKNCEVNYDDLICLKELEYDFGF